MGVVPTAGQLLDVNNNNNNSSNRDRDRDHNKPLLVPPHTAEREYDTAADSILSSQRPSVSPVLSLSLNFSLANMDIHTHTYTHTLSLPLPLPFSFSIYPSASAVGRRFGGPGRLQRFKWLRRAAGRKGGAQVGPDGDCGQELSLSLSLPLSPSLPLAAMFQVQSPLNNASAIGSAIRSLESGSCQT